MKRVILLLIAMLFAAEAGAEDGTIQSFVDGLAEGRRAASRYVATDIGAVWNGTFRLEYGRAIANRTVLGAFLSHYDSERSAIRNEADDWKASVVLGGLSLRYYPKALARTYRGYFLCLDAALSVARHTYEPEDEEDGFTYPAFDFYPAGYTFRLSDRFRADLLAGAGYAPAGDHVEIEGERNDANLYALAGLRLSLWW